LIGAHVSGRPLQGQTHRELVYRGFQFHKCSQHFSGAHNKTLSVTMRVNDPDRSPFNIQS